MKIGLPKLRLSRKLLIVTLGVTVLLGGTSAAALYFKSEDLGLESTASAIGGECTDVQTMVLKTPSNRLWLRRFIRMENASGPERVRTALRIAGLLAKKNAVDLIHVSVLDSRGPTLRSQMRARSVGAEVLIAMKPANLPEMKSPAMASYYEGPVSDAGRYYGDKVVVDIDEIGAMMTAMRSVEEKPDCISPEKNKDAEANPNDHGKKDDHGAKPAEDHGEQNSEDHGEEPANEGADDHSNAEPAKEQSFFDSMLSMVGLGGEEGPAVDHAPATDNSHAVAEEPADAASEDHGEKATSAHEAKPENHGNQAEAQSHEPVKKVKGRDAAEKPVSNHGAVEGAKPVTDGHDAKAAAGHTETGDKVDARSVSAPAEDESAPPRADDHHAAEQKHKVDQHAEVSMPVGD